MDQNFHEAWVNRPHKVLGVWLKPFSLEHFFCLSILESPFAVQGLEFSWEDLERAVAVCRQDRPLKNLYRIREFRPFTLDEKKIRRNRLAFHVAKFCAYVADHHTSPPVALSEGEKAKAPWILRMVETFMAHGRTEEEAWTMITGQAFYRFATIAELETGKSDLLDEDEQALLGQLEEARNAKSESTK